MMRVNNQTRRTSLVKNGSAATNVLARAKGLLWRAPLQPGEGLLIEPCNSVHTFMMSFPIDVIFVSRTNTVVHLIAGMRVGRVSPIIGKAHSVIELPVGMIARSGTLVGDTLEIQR